VADTPEAPDAPEKEVAQDTPKTPEPEAPAEGTPSETPEPTEAEVDFEKRYNDLRPEYDQTQQLLAALQGRHGPEAQAEAGRLIGFEFADDEEAAGDEDEYLDPDTRLDQLEQQLAEKEAEADEAAVMQAEDQWLSNELDGVAKEWDRDLAKEEKDYIASYAVTHRFDDGQPDIEGGAKLLSDLYSQANKRLVCSKRNAPKPPSGGAGDPAIDTSTPEGRKAAIKETAEAAFASE
jgi:hypothetical protein